MIDYLSGRIYTEAIIVWLAAEDHINIDVTNKMRRSAPSVKIQKKTAPGT